MKKIFYLVAFIAIVFTSCDPLSKTYKDLNAIPQTTTITLNTSYTTPAAALAAIPAVLNAGYSQLPNNSSLTVIYSLPANVLIAPDVTLSHIAYTITTSDYAYAGGTFTDFSVAQAAAFLAFKYPTPVANQLVVLTYNYFESGFSPSAGAVTTDTFMYLGGVWTKIYTVTPAQYASVSNRGLTNTFASGDLANILGYLNDFLKGDPSVALTAKAGDTKYVSYRYATTSQEAIPMMFDGTNWYCRSSLIFLKSNGTWIPDPSIYHTVNAADLALLKNQTSISNATARANVAQFGDFNIESSSVYYWSPSDLQAAMVFILTTDFTSPKTGIPYKITYLAYTGTDAPVTLTFTYNGTTWVPQ